MKDKVIMDQVEIATISILRKLEIPQHLSGYPYIKTAVRLLVGKPDFIRRVTRELYPAIANEHNTTSARVERSIRHAAHDHANLEAMKSLLHFQGKKITNSHFLAALAEAVMLQMATESFNEEDV